VVIDALSLVRPTMCEEAFGPLETFNYKLDLLDAEEIQRDPLRVETPHLSWSGVE
jgi:hypothetical protein